MLALFYKNQGKEIVETNFFDLHPTDIGFSLNAGAIRALCPKGRELTEAMVNAQFVIVSAGNHRTAGVPIVELIFEDFSDTPYVLLTDAAAFDRPLARCDHGRTDLEFIAYDCNLSATLRLPARLRHLNSLPCMKPWSESKSHA